MIETEAGFRSYQKAVAAFLKKERLVTLTTLPDCREPYFSWRRCDCCGGIAGMRYDCNGYRPRTRSISGPYSVCEDCVYFHEYGQFD